MKGLLYILVGAACVVGGLLYLHGTPGVYHADVVKVQPENTPAPPVTFQAPVASPTPMIPPESGICYLTMPVEVENKYGRITYRRGEMVRYLGQQGGLMVVERGLDEFTVTPGMLTDGLAAAATPASSSAFVAAGSQPPDASPQELPPDGALASPTPRFSGLLGFLMHPISAVAPDASPSATPADSSQFAEYADCLLIADGAEGKGSGCLVNYQGKPRLVTNAHVISGNANIRFRQMNSGEMVTGPFSFAEGADLAVADQSSSTRGIQIADVDKEVNIGDDVVVLGNSLGSDVVTEIKGQVKGIGPDLVEVDAKFVPGNSGSPIIHVKTGKLIGIATFAERRKLDSLSSDSQFSSEWRRFGYRLDTVKAWDRLSPQQFAAEAQTVESVRKQTENLFRLGQDLSVGKIVLSRYQDPDNRLRDIVTNYVEDSTGRDRTVGTEADARMRFERAIIFETGEDINSLHKANFTWFHWQELQAEMDVRAFLKKAFERLLRTEETGDQMLR